MQDLYLHRKGDNPNEFYEDVIATANEYFDQLNEMACGNAIKALKHR